MSYKSSIHIEKGHIGEFFHNSREKDTVNSIFDTKDNFCNLSGKEAIEIYKEELQKRSAEYTKRTGQKLQKNAITLLSAVVNIKPDTTPEELKKLNEYLEKTLGTRVIQFAIHRDEGYTENGEKKVNHHAHLLMLGLDNDGKSIRKKLDKKFLRELQSATAEILGMERGQDVRKTKRKRLDTYQYKLHKKMESETIRQEKAKDVSRSENLKLKLENRKLKTENERLLKENEELKNMFNDYRKEQVKTVTELKKEISELRRKMIQANRDAEQKIFTAEDYKILSNLKKSLNAKTVKEVEQKLKELREKIEDKILFSNSVHMQKSNKNDFNKKLYVFAKLMQSDYKELEKMGINMDSYFFKKLPEDDEILVGNKQKNLYLKVSPDSITANANPAVSDSEVAEEIFRLATANGKDIMSLEPQGSPEFKRAFYNMQENYLAEILAKNPQKSFNDINI